MGLLCFRTKKAKAANDATTPMARIDPTVCSITTSIVRPPNSGAWPTRKLAQASFPYLSRRCRRSKPDNSKGILLQSGAFAPRAISGQNAANRR